MRIAVIGANGNVGSEVCLLLAREPGVDVVPVCRNRLGSAFLRWQGVACRHGRIAEAAQARALIGDCDVVANFALPVGTPREAHEATVRLVDHSIRHSRPDARVVFFSTLNVYGDPYPGLRLRWRNAYARQKLRAERLALRLGRELGRPTWVLRLGHVTGELQPLSLALREALAVGPVTVPAPERSSNTTHVAAIAAALLAVGRGSVPAGLHDLPNTPPWTWREVVAHEAARAGLEPRLDEPAPVGRVPLRRRVFAGAVALASASPALKQQALQVLAGFSPALNLRLQAVNARARAAREIAALSPAGPPSDALLWRAVGRPPPDGLPPTHTLPGAARDQPPVSACGPAWPDDRPLFTPPGRAP